MFILAILATMLAVVASAFIVFANGMDAAPEKPFRGGWIIFAVCLVAAVLWLEVAFG